VAPTPVSMLIPQVIPRWWDNVRRVRTMGLSSGLPDHSGGNSNAPLHLFRVSGVNRTLLPPLPRLAYLPPRHRSPHQRLPLSMLHFPLLQRSTPDAEIGRTYFLADKIDEAIPHLKRAASKCFIYHDPFTILGSSLLLGRALEQKGDNKGACDAYGKVLARWGNAKPRSVTADEARERSRKLGCGH